MPLHIGREQDAGAYDFLQSVDRQVAGLLNEIRNFRMSKVIRVDDLISSSGEDLDNRAEMNGLSKVSAYLYDSFKQRILNWADTVSGGTHGSIKSEMFYFIGSGAFDPAYDILNGVQIQVEIPNSSATVWGTTAGSTSGDDTWGDELVTGTALWSDNNAIATEDFTVIITLKNGGDDTDRDHYDFWALDANRAQLQEIIAEIKPVGYNNTLKIVSGS